MSAAEVSSFHVEHGKPYFAAFHQAVDVGPVRLDQGRQLLDVILDLVERVTVHSVQLRSLFSKPELELAHDEVDVIAGLVCYETAEVTSKLLSVGFRFSSQDFELDGQLGDGLDRPDFDVPLHDKTFFEQLDVSSRPDYLGGKFHLAHVILDGLEVFESLLLFHLES